MRSTTLGVLRFGLASLLLGTLSARAQSFPSKAEAWAPLRCGNEVMTDRLADEPNALAERDIVGDATRVAGARASDGDYLFLRVRLDADPIPNDVARPSAWGFLFDTDSVLSTYEVLVYVNGIGKTVSLYKNTSTTVTNDSADPPDEPAVKTYPFASHARSVAAAESGFGGNADFFLEVAIPWEDLIAAGLGRTKPAVAWVATSTNSTTLNGDLACFDNAGGGGRTLSGNGSTRSALDPDTDSDADGFRDGTEQAAGTNPNDPASRPTTMPDAKVLAGGGGCESATGLAGLFSAAALLGLVRRRRG